MKKSKIVLSVIALLSFCISACNKQSASNEESSSKEESSQASVSSSQNQSSAVESSEPVSSLSTTSEEPNSSTEESNKSTNSSEESSSSVVQPSGPEIIEGDSFTVTIPEDLSMMSSNCKQYVDDMRAQQEMFLEDNDEADYYLNDLYGLDGVDITKGIPDGGESDILDFETGDYPRWIDARPMFNVRDMGGYMTSSGQRIKQGLIFRGGEITPAVGWKANSYSSYTGDVGGRYTGSNGKMVDEHITSQTDESKAVFREDMNMVNGLEIDLRSSGERNGYSACGFAENGDIDYKLLSISSYDNGMKNNKNEIKQVFEAFAEADEHPVYYHCYGGADRTGVVGFMLGALLGMSYTDLVIDFELTSYSSNPSRNYRSHLRSGPYNYWPRMVNYLKNDLHWSSDKTMQESMEDFLVDSCNIAQSTINTIKDIMLEPLE